MIYRADREAWDLAVRVKPLFSHQKAHVVFSVTMRFAAVDAKQAMKMTFWRFVWFAVKAWREA